MLWFLLATVAAQDDVHVIQYGKPLRTQPEIKFFEASDGCLETTLEVDALDVFHETGKKIYKTRAYNGLLPGPIMRVDAGDCLRVTVDNKLSPYKNDIGTFNAYHYLNTTNLHLHGLHISPDEDDVLAEIKPGHKLTYHYTVRDDHQPGVHWYHPHHHGSVAVQVSGGLEGTFIINEQRGDVPRDLLKVPTIDLNIVRIKKDIVQNVEDFVEEGTYDPVNFPPAGIPPPPAMVGLKYKLSFLDPNLESVKDSEWGLYGTKTFWYGLDTDILLVNGDEAPIVDIQANTWTRIRAVYASASDFLNARIYDDYADTVGELSRTLAKDCKTRLIAKDGVYVHQPLRYFTDVEFFPASRVDFVVKCKKPGDYVWGSFITTEDEIMEEMPDAKAGYVKFVDEKRILTFHVTENDDDVKKGPPPRRGGRGGRRQRGRGGGKRGPPPPPPKDDLQEWVPIYPCYLADMRDVPDELVKVAQLNYDGREARLEERWSVSPARCRCRLTWAF